MKALSNPEIGFWDDVSLTYAPQAAYIGIYKRTLREIWGFSFMWTLEITMEDLVYRLYKRAEIRRQIPTRKSVQEGQPDRLSDLLEEAAKEITRLREMCGIIPHDQNN